MISCFPGDSRTPYSRGFLAWAVLLTLACLWPIWWYRFLPMQDYPQHLFIAHVLSTFNAPEFDWKNNYALNPNWGAYTLTYGILRFFSALTNIEVAGKLLTSLYVLLMTAVVLRAARYHTGTTSPWSLLLIFPCVFNQTYYLGFQSYLLSIPLLFLALMDLGCIASRPATLPSVLHQSGVLFLLFLAHPYSVLVYLVFGFAMAGFYFARRDAFRKILTPLVLVSMLFVAWYIQSSIQAKEIKYDWAVSWWPAEGVAAFYFTMFTGMRWFNGVNYFAVAFWVSVLGLLAFFAVRDWKLASIQIPVAAFLGLALLGFIVMPFWMGYYSYFNLRLAPITYVLLAWLLSGIRLPNAFGHVVGLLAMALVAVSIDIHAKISEETAQLLPVLAKMEKNSAVLPVLVDSGTNVIDATLFYQLHAHDHYYYHLLVGGGVNPLPFQNPMLPLYLRQDRPWPTPMTLNQLPRYRWREVLSKYRYILVRANSDAQIQQWNPFATIAVQSGPWTLLEVRSTPTPTLFDAGR